MSVAFACVGGTGPGSREQRDLPDIATRAYSSRRGYSVRYRTQRPMFRSNHGDTRLSLPRRIARQDIRRRSTRTMASARAPQDHGCREDPVGRPGAGVRLRRPERGNRECEATGRKCGREVQHPGRRIRSAMPPAEAGVMTESDRSYDLPKRSFAPLTHASFAVPAWASHLSIAT